MLDTKIDTMNASYLFDEYQDNPTQECWKKLEKNENNFLLVNSQIRSISTGYSQTLERYY